MAEFTREVARRIFAQELRDSDLSFRENDDQYAPLYLVSPTGARSNRVFVVGALVERDNLGDEVEYWRGRIVDPTGSILVYAGQYQPDAAQVLAATETPSFVAVVGKPSVYETDDGTRLISVRAEFIQKVDAATRDLWILDTSKRTLDRIKAFEEFLQQGGPDAFSSGEDLLSRPPVSEDVADIGKAHLHYETDLERYRDMVIRALESLGRESEKSEPEPVVEGSEEMTDLTESSDISEEFEMPDFKDDEGFKEDEDEDIVEGESFFGVSPKKEKKDL